MNDNVINRIAGNEVMLLNSYSGCKVQRRRCGFFVEPLTSHGPLFI